MIPAVEVVNLLSTKFGARLITRSAKAGHHPICILVDLLHHTYLDSPLIRIFLVDADRICPE